MPPRRGRGQGREQLERLLAPCCFVTFAHAADSDSAFLILAPPGADRHAALLQALDQLLQLAFNAVVVFDEEARMDQERLYGVARRWIVELRV